MAAEHTKNMHSKYCDQQDRTVAWMTENIGGHEGPFSPVVLCLRKALESPRVTGGGYVDPTSTGMIGGCTLEQLCVPGCSSPVPGLTTRPRNSFFGSSRSSTSDHGWICEGRKREPGRALRRSYESTTSFHYCFC